MNASLQKNDKNASKKEMKAKERKVRIIFLPYFFFYQVLKFLYEGGGGEERNENTLKQTYKNKFFVAKKIYIVFVTRRKLVIRNEISDNLNFSSFNFLSPLSAKFKRGRIRRF